VNFAIAYAALAVFVLVAATAQYWQPRDPPLIPAPPAGGCPPAVSTAAAMVGMETLRSGDMGYLEENGITPPQATALVNGDYEGCP
jgi:hypothetical protein